MITTINGAPRSIRVTAHSTYTGFSKLYYSVASIDGEEIKTNHLYESKGEAIKEGLKVVMDKLELSNPLITDLNAQKPTKEAG